MMMLKHYANKGHGGSHQDNTQRDHGLYTTKITLAPHIRRGGASDGHSEGHGGGFDFMDSYTDTEYSYQRHSTRTIIALIVAIVIVAAILGAVLFSMYVFNESSNIEVPPTKSPLVLGENSTISTEQSLQIASKWLLSQRNAQYGWSNTPQVLVALRLSRPDWFLDESRSLGMQEMNTQLSIKQMNTELLEEMLPVADRKEHEVRYKDLRMPAGHLAMYVNAIVAACQNPQDFHKYDMAFSLEKDMDSFADEGNNNYYYKSLALVALCNADSRMQKEIIDDIKSAQQSDGGFQHGIDATSMVVVALSCLSPSKRRKTEVDGTITDAVEYILREKRDDGSFGSELNTANAVQALLAAGLEPESPAINEALQSIVRKQRQDGSYGSVSQTARILPALAKKTYADIKKESDCDVTPTTLTSSFITVHLSLRSDVMGSNNDTAQKSVTFDVTAESGSSLTDILHNTEEQHGEHFRLRAEGGSWGSYIVSINENEVVADEKYWAILTSKDTETSLGIDDVRPQDGDRITLLYTYVT
ncbi:transcobalamin-2-like isoform X3 [Ptychodera flava]|uniref:transcobalamin-2-like isoform X3 n=1 Tax=Ptychodera flava TaxID=63121 RepID=UPI00396A534E